MATAFFGGSFFGGEFFSVSTSSAVGHASKPWKQRWRQELVDLLAAQEEPKPPPKPVRQAIKKVAALEALRDDTEARKALRGELEALQIRYQPRYLESLRWEIAQQYERQLRREQAWREYLDQDDEEVIFLLFH